MARRLLSVLLLAALALPAHADGDAPSTRVVLKAKDMRRFALDVPNVRWRPVGAAIDFTSAGGPRFAATETDGVLAVDRDADGTPDVRIEGADGFVALGAAATEARAAFRRGLRLRRTEAGWQYAIASVRRATVLGTRVTLVDANANGRHGEVGQDAIVVGHGDVASLLGETIAIGNALHRIVVAGDGAHVEVAPHKGKSGLLDMRAGFQSEARLLALRIVSTDGRQAFELAAHAGAVRVPVGTYRLADGRLGKGTARVAIQPGAMATFGVAPDKTTTPRWGGPVTATFDVARQDGQLGFDPARIRYRGRGGEAYVDWTPLGASPEFRLMDPALGKEIQRVVFAGSG